jgi:hypothetical protein
LTLHLILIGKFIPSLLIFSILSLFLQ